MVKNTKAAATRKPRAPKKDRIPVIRQRKAGSAAKTPGAPKASKATKTSKSSGAGKNKSTATALLTDVEVSEAEEEQSELYSKHSVYFPIEPS